MGSVSAPESRTSPLTTVHPSGAANLLAGPRTRARTRNPLASRASSTWPPTNPVAPVRNTSSGTGFSPRASGRGRLGPVELAAHRLLGCPQRLPQGRRRGDDGRRLVAAVRHALRALLVAAATVAFPV